MMSKLRLIFLIILITGLFFKCKQNYPVPEVYVNFYEDLKNPMNQSLNIVGGSVLIPNQGNKGIIIIRTDFEEFRAYDATCTYDPDHRWGRVVPEKNGLFATDTVCGSKFNIFYDGYANDGPASVPLKMYVVESNGETLFIHN